MTDDNDHLAKLVDARARMVAERRDVARALTEKYKRGQTTEMRELLVQIQTTIDAIDRAIADEKNMTSMPAQMAPGVKIGTTDKE